ncbi:MAG: hypothetical protein IPM38_12095 [Ignavibacteria bacterium]|nr:hypothetical protein [Ignavibacteria bacterium]
MNKTNNIYFPLCCLNYGKNIKQTANLLISFGIVEYAEKLKGWELTDNDFEKIEQYINEQTLNDADEEEDYFIILSAISLNISIYNLSHTKKNHADIERHIGEFEREHGADAKIKIHKGILFEFERRQI